MKETNVSIIITTIVAAVIIGCNYAIIFAIQETEIIDLSNYQIELILSFFISGCTGGYLQGRPGITGAVISSIIILSIYTASNITESLWVISFVFLLIVHVLFILGYAAGTYAKHITRRCS